MTLKNCLLVPVHSSNFVVWRAIKLILLAGFLYFFVDLMSRYPLNELWIMGLDSSWFKGDTAKHYLEIVRRDWSTGPAVTLLICAYLFERLEATRLSVRGWIDFSNKSWVVEDFLGKHSTDLDRYEKVQIVATGSAQQPHDVWLYPPEKSSAAQLATAKKLNTFADRWQARQFATILADLGKLSLGERSEDGVWEHKSGKIFILQGMEGKGAEIEMPELLAAPPSGAAFQWETNPCGYARISWNGSSARLTLWGNRLEYCEWNKRVVLFYDEISYLESKGGRVYLGGPHQALEVPFSGAAEVACARWLVSLLKYLGGHLEDG